MLMAQSLESERASEMAVGRSVRAAHDDSIPPLLPTVNAMPLWQSGRRSPVAACEAGARTPLRRVAPLLMIVKVIASNIMAIRMDGTGRTETQDDGCRASNQTEHPALRGREHLRREWCPVRHGVIHPRNSRSAEFADQKKNLLARQPVTSGPLTSLPRVFWSTLFVLSSLMLFAAPQAFSATLVKNTEQATASRSSFTVDLAQGFRTGGHADRLHVDPCEARSSNGRHRSNAGFQRGHLVGIRRQSEPKPGHADK